MSHMIQLSHMRYISHLVKIQSARHISIYTRRYGSLCGPTSRSSRRLWPSSEALFALWAKIWLVMLFWHIIGHFWCSVTLSSNINDFEEKNQTNSINPK